MSRLTPVQKNDRRDFVLNRLKRGFSFLEVQKQFVENFGCCMDTARKWVNWACDQVTAQDDPRARKRVFATIVEMYHDQIVAFQNELIQMQREVDRVSHIIDRRSNIMSELETATGRRHRELLNEMKGLPEVSPSTRAALVEAKTRVRERMYRVMNDLARLQGFTGVQSDWRAALCCLLDNNLLPPTIADGILTVIDQFESNIRTLEVKLPSAEYSGYGDPDLDDVEPVALDDLNLPDLS